MKPDEKGEVSLAQKVIRTYTYVAIWIGLSATVILVSPWNVPPCWEAHQQSLPAGLMYTQTAPLCRDSPEPSRRAACLKDTALGHPAACAVPRSLATASCQPAAYRALSPVPCLVNSALD